MDTLTLYTHAYIDATPIHIHNHIDMLARMFIMAPKYVHPNAEDFTLSQLITA